jgi:hypothetical protein
VNGKRIRALQLAEAGWAVLPLDGKRPVTEHGHHDATTDPATIRRMWSEKDWNVGSPIPDNLIVLDVDPRNGGSVEALEQRAGVALPPTLEVITGRRDGGRHLYFRRPFDGRVYRRDIPQGIDVKTSGYMVMPPSHHPDTGKSYQWIHRDIASLPLGVIRLMVPRLPKPARSPTSTSPSALATFVRDLQLGERHNGLLWAASRAHEAGVRGYGLRLLVDAAVDVGFPQREAERVIESARTERT